MVLDAAHGAILIDCAGGPIGRLQRAAIPLNTLRTIIITHNHPDHSYGLPVLLMSLWLLGRREPLDIRASAHAISRLRTIMGAYEWNDWPNFFPIEFVAVPMEEGAPVLNNEDFVITAVPCDHFVPTFGVKIVSRTTGYATLYTSDTAPTEVLRRAAQGVDLLIHEAAGATTGHSSAGMAGRLAGDAKIGKLVLIHYQVYADQNALLAEARSEFGGPIEIAQDFSEYPL